MLRSKDSLSARREILMNVARLSPIIAVIAWASAVIAMPAAPKLHLHKPAGLLVTAESQGCQVVGGLVAFSGIFSEWISSIGKNLNTRITARIPVSGPAQVLSRERIMVDKEVGGIGVNAVTHGDPQSFLAASRT